MAERLGVAVPSDELRLGVKCLTDHDLAGSPRNTSWRGPLAGSRLVQHSSSGLVMTRRARGGLMALPVITKLRIDAIAVGVSDHRR